MVTVCLPRLDQCLELLIRTNRLPEAALLARTYLPSQVSRVVKLWRENLTKVNQKVGAPLWRSNTQTLRTYSDGRCSLICQCERVRGCSIYHDCVFTAGC